MKIKKYVAAVAGVAMACALATSAFAATDAQVARAQAYLNSKGISYTVTASDVDKALAAGYTADSLAAEADSLLAQVVADPSKADAVAAQAKSILSGIGISVDNVSVSVSGGNVTISAAVNGQSVSKTVAVADDHGDIGPAIENGTWGVDENTASTATTLTSSASSTAVIKATGDNAGILLISAVLSLAAVLGLAARKYSQNA